VSDERPNEREAERRKAEAEGTAKTPTRRRGRGRGRRGLSRGQMSKVLDRLGRGAQNAAELMRMGRLSAPYRAPFDVAREERTYRLRHYGAMEGARRAKPIDAALRPVLLVPPLMVASEVYDISPELSSVQMLLDAGLDVWLTDFGAPEREAGGMERTLDDHVRGVSDCIDEIVRATGKPVHLAGYSQGGMFCYQVAAFRESRDIASLVTFGSPVDIRQNLPVSSRAAERVIDLARSAAARPLEAIEGLPGFLTATGFKLLSVRKEVQQVVDFVASLHDREKLEQRESRRRFLAGEGFVAWPGPAFRKFVDEFIVGNRMASGGFVIEGRTVTLADVRCPILYFVGTKDEIARAPSVRSIEQAAPQADTYEVDVRAGHFGIVVGSTAVRVTWPTVIEWVRWLDAEGPLPEALEEDDDTPARSLDDVDEDDLDAVPMNVELFYDVATSAIDAMTKRVGHYSREIGDLVDNLRWQVPRLNKLRSVEPDTRIGLGLALAEQAAAIPDNTFFLWKGRAFSYRDADRRVTAIVHGLFHAGVRPGDKVGVLMEPRPSYLSIVAALNRMGAVAVLLSPESSRVSLAEAARLSGMQHLVCDPDNAALARNGYTGPVLALGGGPPGTDGRPSLPEGVIDMEAIDPAAVVLPEGFRPDDARAADLAMIIFTAGRRSAGGNELARPARITNRRWAFSALGAAAGCALTSHDTVYCCLPLHHAAGMLVAVGGALVGGSRLAVGERFERERFVQEVHRYGASVVFYAGELLRPLVDAPRSPLDEAVPIRLFAGSGMRADLWQKLRDRYPRAKVLEFYASTEGNAVLANTRGKKLGALGKPLPGSADLALVAWDFEKHFAGRERDALRRDERGTIMLAGADEPGALVARIDPSHPMASFDGYEGDAEGGHKVLRGVVEPGDAWFVTGDLLRRDADGDFWFVDRIVDVVARDGQPVFTHGVEDALLEIPSIRSSAVVGIEWRGKSVLAAMVSGRPPTDLDLLSREIADVLPPAKRPELIRWVEALPLTDGFRPRKTTIREELARAPSDGRTFVLDGARYRMT
jgi:putative long chain acyl-CoA synthase